MYYKQQVPHIKMKQISFKTFKRRTCYTPPPPNFPLLVKYKTKGNSLPNETNKLKNILEEEILNSSPHHFPLFVKYKQKLTHLKMKQKRL